MNGPAKMRTAGNQIGLNSSAKKGTGYLHPHILRISTVETSRTRETLRLEGHLGGPWVDELRRSCDRVLSHGRQLTLDLSGVSFIAHDGVGLLRALKVVNVELRNCSAFIALQIEGDSVDD